MRWKDLPWWKQEVLLFGGMFVVALLWVLVDPVVDFSLYGFKLALGIAGLIMALVSGLRVLFHILFDRDGTGIRSAVRIAREGAKAVFGLWVSDAVVRSMGPGLDWESAYAPFFASLRLEAAGMYPWISLAFNLGVVTALTIILPIWFIVWMIRGGATRK